MIDAGFVGYGKLAPDDNIIFESFYFSALVTAAAVDAIFLTKDGQSMHKEK